MARLIDLSNYSRRLSEQQVTDLIAAGFNGAIVQSINPPPGYPSDVDEQQLAMLRAQGIEFLQGYLFWWFGNTPDYLGPLLATLEQYGVRKVWLDVEDTTEGISPAQRIAEVHTAVEYIQALGFRVGIYSARWFWTAYMDDCTDFADLPLWVAQYDGDPGAPVVLFGGWHRAQIKQYAGDTTIAGIPAIDLNVEVEEMETRDLNGDETLALFNAEAKRLDRVIHDDPGYHAAEIVSGYPVAPGARAFVVMLPAADVPAEVGG